MLRRVHDEYAPPRIYVTENGAAFADVRGHDGRVLDPERSAYLEGRFEAVRRAIVDGVPVHGDYAWSPLDNFERAPKASFGFYRDYIARQRASSAGAADAVPA